MDCSVPTSFRKSASPSSSALKSIPLANSPPRGAGLHVNFEPETEEINERKKKYLTAKYGQHQMGLIKKRLRVEMWMYDQLQFLYGCTSDSENYEVEIDLDELLDIESDGARKEWLKKKLTGIKQGDNALDVFIDELLQRAKTL